MADYYSDIIQTERLRTRLLTLEDAPLWAPFLEEPEILSFMPKFGLEAPTTSLGRAQFWMERNLKRYQEKRLGFHALIEKASGSFIGQCGLLIQDVNGKKEIEVAYHLLAPFRSKGYAIEAAQAFRDYAFSNAMTDNLVSIIASHNLRSQKLAEKNGMKPEQTMRWLDLDIIIYRLYQKDWLGLKKEERELTI